MDSKFLCDVAITDQGQGGAQSVEDGAAISIMLQNIKSESQQLDQIIEQRLEAFEAVRRQRASLMQIFSNAGQDEAEKVRDEAARLLGSKETLKVPTNQTEFHDFNFGYDVMAESDKVLQSLGRVEIA
ncbi:MAG: hypothetical protein Q9195_006560 [Heterodermia aff. obscurata]